MRLERPDYQCTSSYARVSGDTSLLFTVRRTVQWGCLLRISRNVLIVLVGGTGIEPVTPAV
jgi:hypothetical protein